MSQDLQKIFSFIDAHHVMSMATYADNELSACNLFYAFEKQSLCFVIASADDTRHIEHIKKNPQVAGTIVLETSKVSQIQGLQFRGRFEAVQNSSLEKLYFATFPYSRALMPKLWCIKVEFFKLTDNRLGFGKKILWEKE